jgi:RNA polymerase sigma-70 factor (ECF subfamily)
MDISDTSKPDEKLIRQYLHGDEASLEILIKRYLSLVYNFSRRYAGDPFKAADITQETFVKIWKNLRKFDTRKNFKPWILAITKNTALDWLKRREDTPLSAFENETTGENYLEAIADNSPAADALFDAAETQKTIRGAINELPEKHRAVVRMRNDEQLTFKEIAEVLKEPLNTVKNRYWRALQSIKKKLSERTGA